MGAEDVRVSDHVGVLGDSVPIAIEPGIATMPPDLEGMGISHTGGHLLLTHVSVLLRRASKDDPA
jgi:hypothetical protein